jgi:NADPH:quinone reductase-like Zn-dependent oxidoreductase
MGRGGAAGTMAIQIAKAAGARVNGVDRAEKLELMRGLGADRAVDFSREDFTRGSERYDLGPGSTRSYGRPAQAREYDTPSE